MHRFYLPSSECREATLTLGERESHHATSVLRLREGDPATVLDGEGTELKCEIVAPNRGATKLRVLGRRQLPALSCAVTLFQAVPKGKTMDEIIEKAVELGASRIVPLLTERTVVQLGVEEARTKQERWQLTAIEALKQCGAPWLPRVELPVPLEVWLRNRGTGSAAELSLVGALEVERRTARESFTEFRARHGRAPQSVALWVGPEGDFTADELQAIIGSGAQPVSFGPLVLRCDTAAMFALSVATYETLAHQAAHPPR